MLTDGGHGPTCALGVSVHGLGACIFPIRKYDVPPLRYIVLIYLLGNLCREHLVPLYGCNCSKLSIAITFSYLIYILLFYARLKADFSRCDDVAKDRNTRDHLA